MNQTQSPGARLRALHTAPGCFVIPNPWDAGSAKALAALGFPALATTSGGLAFTLGRRDGQRLVTRAEALANAADIVAATPLPVSADLENGYGDTPSTVAQTITAAAGVGLAGASIEDASGDPSAPIYARELAVDRIAAAVAAARAAPDDFVLTARAENYLHGKPDLADTIARLQAFQAAGADVLYAPGLRSLEDIATVVREVDRPLNVVMGLAGANFSLADLAAMGVKRVSVGSSLYRAAFGALLDAAREISQDGTFDYAGAAAPGAVLDKLFSGEGPGEPERPS